MHHKEQFGDYVLELPHPRGFWSVRMAGDTECISEHNAKSEARTAIKRYQAIDRRRAEGSKPMTEQQLDAYRLMYKALGKALDEIHNPGSNRACGADIVSHIEAVRQEAGRVAPPGALPGALPGAYTGPR